MGGGLLNLVAYGNQNIILNGNPSKTFFKCTYAKYTNFGLQKFRIDYNGLRTLRMTEPSVFQFKVPRYGDLLMDTYLVVNLPTIWSPIQLVKHNTDYVWRPYEFKWIENLGCQMIKRVRFSIGGQIIQDFTGDYLYNLVERDFDSVKKKLFYEMTGNIAELNDPANAFKRDNTYPSAYKYTTDEVTYNRYGPEPSIRGRELYIPLNIWFTLAAKMAFPLVALQYQELNIEIEMRPVNELFVVRTIDITQNDIIQNDLVSSTEYSSGQYIQPKFNETKYQFYTFLQPPPGMTSDRKLNYVDTRTDWNADIHILSTYGFLSDEEIRVFASRPQQYLIREVYQYTFENVTGSNRVALQNTQGMVTNWMWFFQRSDAYERNQWSNYTNWPYNDKLPFNVISKNLSSTTPNFKVNNNIKITPFNNYIKTTQPSNISITGKYQQANVKNIMETWGLLFDGKYRENTLNSGVLSYVEKYTRTSGCAPEGLYCYNFCLQTDPFDFQPSGACNLSKFNKIEFEFTTYLPALKTDAPSNVICGIKDGETTILGVTKSMWDIYEYSYNLTVMEERYNVLTFTSGNAGLMYAR